MIIRNGNKFDVDEILRMVKAFVMESNLSERIKNNLDTTHVNRLYHHIILGAGVMLVVEDQGKLVGMIAGIKVPNIWDEKDHSLREILFYIEPEHRKGRVAYKMLMEYNKSAQELLNANKISNYTMTKNEFVDKIDYSRFGYSKIEETWAIGL
jgi:GNAT superfamily N-acetyltransferase